MAAIPSATESVRDGGLNVTPPASMLPIYLGHCTVGDTNVLELYSSAADLRDGRGEGPVVESAANCLATGGGPVGVLRMTASIAASIGQVLPTFGANGSNGVVTEAGASPPDITPSGNPKGHYQMRVEINTTGGARGTALLRWSIDNGSTWVASGVTSAATVELKTATFDTGITIAMAVGTYATDNVYTWTATPGGGQVAVSGTPNYDALVRVEIVTAGALGVARFRYCLDGYEGDKAAERTYSENLFVPSGGAFVVPGLGVTITFDDTPTAFVAGDSYLCPVEAPACNATNLGAAFTALQSEPTAWRFCVVVTSKGNGDAAAHALLGTALQTHLTTLAGLSKYRRGMIAATHEDTAAASVAAWDDVVAPRTLVAHGQVRRATIKPFSGWAFPITNAVDVIAARAVASLPSTDLKRVRSGSLVEVTKLFHDEYRSPSVLDDVKVSTLRTYENKSGRYITQARLKSADGSDFTVWPRGILMDIACETANRVLVEEIGRGVRTETVTIDNVQYPGVIDERDGAIIAQSCADALAAQLLTPLNAEGLPGHVQDVRVTVSRTHNFLATGVVIVEVAIKPLGYVDYIRTTLGFVASLPEAA